MGRRQSSGHQRDGRLEPDRRKRRYFGDQLHSTVKYGQVLDVGEPTRSRIRSRETNMSTSFVILVATLGAMIGCLFFSNILITAMIGEINRRRPDNDQLSYLGFTPTKSVKVFTQYRRLHPEGRLHLLAIGCFIIAMLLLILVAVQLAHLDPGGDSRPGLR